MLNNENSTEVHTLSPENDWGPRRDPLFVVIPFTALFSTIFLTGLVGNVTTCIVIVRNKSMHTATNYYLFSLAISDLVLLISGLPQEMYGIWSKYPYVFGEEFCILQGFAAETSANATVLTITAFTVERYIAICHPFLSQTMSKLSRVVKLVIMIWILAMCLAIPQAMSFGIISEEGVDDHCVCNVKRDVIPHAFLISTLVFFVAPMSLITILYILIGLRLRQSSVRPVSGVSVSLPRRQSSRIIYRASNHALIVTNCNIANPQGSAQDEEDRRSCPNQSQTASRRVVKMLIAVVVAFFICWAPFHAQRLLVIYYPIAESEMTAIYTIYSILTYTSGVLYYVSTTINPVLYHIMSNKFRRAFKETYAVCLGKQRHNRIPPRYSNLSNRFSQEKTTPTSTGERSLLELKSVRPEDVKRKLKLCKNGRSAVSSGCVKQCTENASRTCNASRPSNYANSATVSSFLHSDKFDQDSVTIKLVEKATTREKRSSSYRLKTEDADHEKGNLLKSITLPNLRVGYCITINAESSLSDLL